MAETTAIASLESGVPSPNEPPGLIVAEAAPILFVDDDPEILRALQISLKRSGLKSVIARSAENASALLEEHEFAVIVCDYWMPDIDGVQFLAQVRERFPDIERILLTGNIDSDVLQSAINKAGISRFIRKPWGRDGLLSILRQASEQSRVRKEHSILLERLQNRNEELDYVNRLLKDKVTRSNENIHLFRRRWDAALNAISDAITIVGPHYQIEGANAAAAEMALCQPQQLEGQKCYEMLFDRKSPCHPCVLKQSPARLTTNKQGNERVFDARSYRLPGNEVSHLCVYRDITKQMAMEREAMQTDKMAAIGRLAGGVAHEINNPLHGIVSFVHLAQKPEVAPEKLQHYLGIIRDCALRCRDIVASLRDFSRLPKQSDRRVIDVNQACDKVLVLFTDMGGKSIEFRRRDPKAKSNAGMVELQQVITNLVQNAVDASPPNGRVYVDVVVDGGMAVVSVEDNGPGVPVAELEKIFEPFYTTKPEGIGTGLGLAISHTIMSDLGGGIRVANLAQGGARFEAFLPIATEPKSD